MSHWKILPNPPKIINDVILEYEVDMPKSSEQHKLKALLYLRITAIGDSLFLVRHHNSAIKVLFCPEPYIAGEWLNAMFRNPIDLLQVHLQVRIFTI
jgi:hypothetical protein